MQSKEIILQIQEIYSKYEIPQNLKRHMLLVAGVAEEICDNFTKPVDKENIVAAALIHDLGNIIKMKLYEEKPIKLLDKKDRENILHLRKIQKEFCEKYGENAEEANELIAQEIKAPKKVIYLLTNGTVTFANKKASIHPDLEKQIVSYADMRVAPHGVVSINKRLSEYAKRYKINTDPERIAHSKRYGIAIHSMEKNIFENVKIKPAEITNTSVKKYILKYGWKEK